MGLENPLALLGLLIIPLIIILRWLQQKPLTVLVPSIILWRKLPPADISHQGLQWQRYLILVMQVLSISLLVTALAGPVLYRVKPVSKDVVIILDNSTSMTTLHHPAQGGGLSRWEIVMGKARELIQRCGTEDKISIFYPYGSVIRVDKAAALETLEQMRPMEIPSTLEETVSRVVPLLKDASTLVYLYSDRLPAEQLRAAFNANLNMVLIGGSSDNKAITHISATGKDKDAYDIFMSVRNYSTSAAEVTITISVISGSAAAAAIGTQPITLAAGEMRPVVFPSMRLPAGANIQAELKTNDDMVCDNKVFLAPSAGKVCLVGQYSESIAKALKGNQIIVDHFPVLTTPSYSALQDYALWIFNNTAVNDIPNIHKAVIINPSSDSPLWGIAGKVSPVADIAQADSPLLKFTSLSDVNIKEPLKFIIKEKEYFKPLVWTGTDVLMGEWQKGDQHVIIIGFDTEWRSSQSQTDWATQPSFPIFWKNLIDYLSINSGDYRYYHTGELIPEISDRFFNTGIYQHKNGTVAVNLCDDKASDNSGITEEILPTAAWTGDKKIKTTTNLGLVFIIPALLLLVGSWYLEQHYA
ncbi:MAG: BatA domain-containing protein [Planctomycetes bacterium]|nr:BatA domain-containing protein [Planctomycetota bacterium]